MLHDNNILRFSITPDLTTSHLRSFVRKKYHLSEYARIDFIYKNSVVNSTKPLASLPPNPFIYCDYEDTKNQNNEFSSNFVNHEQSTQQLNDENIRHNPPNFNSIDQALEGIMQLFRNGTFPPGSYILTYVFNVRTQTVDLVLIPHNISQPTTHINPNTTAPIPEEISASTSDTNTQSTTQTQNEQSQETTNTNQAKPKLSLFEFLALHILQFLSTDLMSEKLTIIHQIELYTARTFRKKNSYQITSDIIGEVSSSFSRMYTNKDVNWTYIRSTLNVMYDCVLKWIQEKQVEGSEKLYDTFNNNLIRTLKTVSQHTEDKIPTLIPDFIDYLLGRAEIENHEITKERVLIGMKKNQIM
ncbi:hypothetical protein QTN25_005291 [Entamoeba marina]